MCSLKYMYVKKKKKKKKNYLYTRLLSYTNTFTQEKKKNMA